MRSKERKPLVLRGARQVGKTWRVRDLAASASLDLLELNFERNPEYLRLFATNSPQTIFDETLLNLPHSLAWKLRDWPTWPLATSGT